ncbi:hypothetical protein D917_07778 [Trichinella nativa]|uniref:Uncharacterized protein n=1 Tax=Trichinella nativa TaxID=6335 RepID=A0A1Y3ER47_9BILA|nr:hypothetical protein D917_07778 [Trichinella nativa]
MAKHAMKIKYILHWFDHVAQVDLQQAWPVLKLVIQHQLLDNMAMPLPFLSDVDYYSMGSCILKKATPLTRRFFFVEDVRWKPVGSFETLAKEMIPLCLKKSKNCLHCIEATINPKYHYTFNAPFGGNVEMEVKINNTMRQFILHFLPEEICFNMKTLALMNDGKPPSSIYIIHERFLAREMFVMISRGGQSKKYTLKNFPIAIVLTKYQLTKEGRPVRDKEIRGYSFMGNWLRVSDFKWPAITEKAVVVDKLLIKPGDEILPGDECSTAHEENSENNEK